MHQILLMQMLNMFWKSLWNFHELSPFVNPKTISISKQIKKYYILTRILASSKLNSKKGIYLILIKKIKKIDINNWLITSAYPTLARLASKQ